MSSNVFLPRSQAGAALIVALIFLVIITLITISGVRFTSGSVRGALNEQFRINAFVNAQSIVDGVITNSANTPVTTGTGQTFCTTSGTCPAANRIIVLPNGLMAPEIAAGTVVAQATRLEPEQAPPPRGTGASLNKFFAATFRVEGSYDETATGQGRTQINEGVILLLPKS